MLCSLISIVGVSREPSQRVVAVEMSWCREARKEEAAAPVLKAKSNHDSLLTSPFSASAGRSSFAGDDEQQTLRTPFVFRGAEDVNVIPLSAG